MRVVSKWKDEEMSEYVASRLARDMSPTPVAVLGTGAIGSAVTMCLMAAGHAVTVWNRSPARAEPLVAAGASPASSPAEAADRGDLVMLCMTSYDAVAETLDAAGPALTGRMVVVMTTGTADDARAAAASVEAWGATYLDAGVQTGPGEVGTAQAMFVFSGSEVAYRRHETTLAALGPGHFVGSDPGAAAVQDLTLFGLWYDAQLGLLRAYETLLEAGVDLRPFAALAAKQLGHVVAGAAEAAAEITRREYARGPASLDEHEPVMRNIASLRKGLRLGTGGIESAADLTQAAIMAGRQSDGLTALLADSHGLAGAHEDAAAGKARDA